VLTVRVRVLLHFQIVIGGRNKYLINGHAAQEK
jgi:hypothetical protein